MKQVKKRAQKCIARLERLIEEGEELNYRENFFKFNVTDFCEIKILHKQFGKYVKLWDFTAEFWEFKRNLWTQGLFTELKQRTYHLYCFTRIGEIGLPPLPEAQLQPPPQQQPSGAGAVNLSVVPTSSQSVNLSVSPAEKAMDVS